MKIPSIAEWHMYGGGTSALPDTHGYAFYTPEGEFHVNAPTRRGSGYHIMWASSGKGGHPEGSHTGLWHEVGIARSPASAAVMARKWYKLAYPRSNPQRRGLRNVGDRRVIEAFTNRQSASSKKLTTDGQRLDGNWMGGSNIAHWVGEQISLNDLGSKAAQKYQRAIRKIVPARWIMGNPRRNSAVRLPWQPTPEGHAGDVRREPAGNPPRRYKGAKPGRKAKWWTQRPPTKREQLEQLKTDAFRETLHHPPGSVEAQDARRRHDDLVAQLLPYYRPRPPAEPNPRQSQGGDEREPAGNPRGGAGGSLTFAGLSRGPYSEYAPAQEYAMKLRRDASNKGIQIKQRADGWWIEWRVIGSNNPRQPRKKLAVNDLFRKYCGFGPVDVDRLYRAIQREKKLAEAGTIRVSPGLLTELRSELAYVGSLRRGNPRQSQAGDDAAARELQLYVDNPKKRWWRFGVGGRVAVGSGTQGQAVDKAKTLAVKHKVKVSVRGPFTSKEAAYGRS